MLADLKKDLVKEKPYSKAFRQKNDKSGLVKVNTKPTTQGDVTTIKFTQQTTNKKGKPQTQPYKTYNKIEELIEDLGLTDTDEINDIKDIQEAGGGLQR